MEKTDCFRKCIILEPRPCGDQKYRVTSGHLNARTFEFVVILEEKRVKYLSSGNLIFITVYLRFY